MEKGGREKREREGGGVAGSRMLTLRTMERLKQRAKTHCERCLCKPARGRVGKKG